MNARPVLLQALVSLAIPGKATAAWADAAGARPGATSPGMSLPGLYGVRSAKSSNQSPKSGREDVGLFGVGAVRETRNGTEGGLLCATL